MPGARPLPSTRVQCSFHELLSVTGDIFWKLLSDLRLLRIRLLIHRTSAGIFLFSTAFFPALKPTKYLYDWATGYSFTGVK